MLTSHWWRPIPSGSLLPFAGSSPAPLQVVDYFARPARLDDIHGEQRKRCCRYWNHRWRCTCAGVTGQAPAERTWLVLRKVRPGPPDLHTRIM